MHKPFFGDSYDYVQHVAPYESPLPEERLVHPMLFWGHPPGSGLNIGEYVVLLGNPQASLASLPRRSHPAGVTTPAGD